MPTLRKHASFWSAAAILASFVSQTASADTLEERLELFKKDPKALLNTIRKR